jgi:fatty acid-binding protein DegV
LGWLVEAAAGAALAGETIGQIIAQARVNIAHIYLLYFISEPAVLVESAGIGPAQALVAGMLGIHPVFLLEDGRLTLVEKTRSQRGVLEYFEEFLDEFDSPACVALVHGSEPSLPRLGVLRQHIQGAHPQAQFVEQAFSPHVEAILGKKSIGLAVKQKG